MGPGTTQPMGVVTSLPRQQAWALGSWAERGAGPGTPASTQQEGPDQESQVVVNLPAFPEKAPKALAWLFPILRHLQYLSQGTWQRPPLRDSWAPPRRAMWSCLSGLGEVKKRG